MKKLSAFFAILIVSAALIFFAFPVEYARFFGRYEHTYTANRIAVGLTDFHIRNGLRYKCGYEVYFGWGTPFAGDVPGVPLGDQEVLGAEHKVVMFFLSDVWADENDEFVEDLRRYNLFLSGKCPVRSSQHNGQSASSI